LLLAAACGSPDVAPANSSAASIESFTASPESIAPGETATLTASFSNGNGTIDQGIGPIGSGATVLVAPTSNSVYTLVVVDSMGRAVTQTAYVTWTIDLTPPTATIATSTANPTNQTTASLSFDSSKAGSTFSCKLDSGAAASCTAPRSYTGLLAGSHVFTVTATDPAGNVSAPASFAWTIDSTPPVATITASPASPTNQTTASFSFVSSQASSTFSRWLDAGAAAACPSPPT